MKKPFNPYRTMKRTITKASFAVRKRAGPQSKRSPNEKMKRVKHVFRQKMIQPLIKYALDKNGITNLEIRAFCYQRYPYGEENEGLQKGLRELFKKICTKYSEGQASQVINDFNDLAANMTSLLVQRPPIHPNPVTDLAQVQAWSRRVLNAAQKQMDNLKRKK